VNSGTDRLQRIHRGFGKLRAFMQQCNQMGKVDETFPFFFVRPSLFRERRKKTAVFFRIGDGAVPWGKEFRGKGKRQER